VQASGWLLIPRESGKWLKKFTAIRYRSVRTFTNEYGRLVWMEYVEGTTSAGRTNKSKAPKVAPAASRRQ
jgi:hypothetical protein